MESRFDVYAENLGLRATLDLFVRVCDAVARAHRNLVVHRDLKPSNLLVDAEGQPKLLDFGIAKSLDVTNDETRTRERLLTPQYASPEQIQGAVISTSTDIYLMGAVLYKLLTGRSPHEWSEPLPDGLESAICTRDVPDPVRLNPALAGDLDAILRHALRKDPRDRYSSVEAFAEDIRAYLETRPVRARGKDRWYRVRKFLRRYWIPSTAGAHDRTGHCQSATAGCGTALRTGEERGLEFWGGVLPRTSTPHI